MTPAPAHSPFIISQPPRVTELNFKGSGNKEYGQGISNEIPRHWLSREVLRLLKGGRRIPWPEPEQQALFEAATLCALSEPPLGFLP